MNSFKLQLPISYTVYENGCCAMMALMLSVTLPWNSLFSWAVGAFFADIFPLYLFDD